jgi:hypothetical protein
MTQKKEIILPHTSLESSSTDNCLRCRYLKTYVLGLFSGTEHVGLQKRTRNVHLRARYQRRERETYTYVLGTREENSKRTPTFSVPENRTRNVHLRAPMTCFRSCSDLLYLCTPTPNSHVTEMRVASDQDPGQQQTSKPLRSTGAGCFALPTENTTLIYSSLPACSRDSSVSAVTGRTARQGLMGVVKLFSSVSCPPKESAPFLRG